MNTFPPSLTLLPLTAPPDAVISVPGSKSLTNRALILAALANGTSTLHHALTSEDTEIMQESLRRLGFAVTANAALETITVVGQGGKIPNAEIELFCGNSGTSLRFLTALCALGKGKYRLDGVERMRQRPQQDLLNGLGDLGVHARSERGDGHPPLLIDTQGLRGGTARLSADASTQFVSALLMASPYARHGTALSLHGSLRPHYVDLTRRMMAEWGVRVFRDSDGVFHVDSGQTYTAQTACLIEPDASSASYFFAAAALTGGRVTVPGLSETALQGDVRFATEVLREMGCGVVSEAQGLTVQGPPQGQLRGIERNFGAISDTALTVAALAPFASTPTLVTGIAHSRKQECDRVSAVCTELRKLGVTVEEREDGYRIFPLSPGQKLTPAAIETYHDHRVAMSFALIGLVSPGLTILDPGCVAKTFPGYWPALERLRA